jgi:uncharacterized protein
MPVDPEAPHLPRSAAIEAYGKGGFHFDTMSHQGSLLKASDIDRHSLRRVFEGAAGIDTLIIGTGNEVWIVPNDLRNALRNLHVVIDAMQTGPAIRTYNVMLGERRRVAAALIAVP